MLDRLLPTPRLVEIEHVDIAAAPEHVWNRIRHGDLTPSPLIRALFAIRELPSRLRGKPVSTAIPSRRFTLHAGAPGISAALRGSARGADRGSHRQGVAARHPLRPCRRSRRGHYFVLHAAAGRAAQESGRPWASMSKQRAERRTRRLWQTSQQIIH